MALLENKMPNKQFSERLNKELDKLGLPLLDEERVSAFAKLLKVPKFKSASLLSGAVMPDVTLLDNLCRELEVNPEWLLGRSTSRHKSNEEH